MRNESQGSETLTKDPTPRWANLISVVIIIVIFDFAATLSTNPKLQYVIVVAPISYILLSNFEKSKKDRLSSLCLISGLLWTFGMTGVYWGKIVERNTDGALPLIWPLAVLMFASYQIESSVNVRKGMVLLGYLSNIVALEGIVSRLYFPRGIFNFSHEKAYLYVFAISVGIMYKKKILTIISSTLLIGNFLVYPALTYVLCGITAIIVAKVINGQYVAARFFVFQVFSIFYLYYSTFQINQPGSILDSSYNLLNRNNNVAYREYLIGQVKGQITESFWLGSGFRRSVLVDSSSSSLPVHNDFVTVVLGGGIISLGLYLSIYILTNYNLFTRINEVMEDDSRKALICLGILVNSYFFCSSANPISMKPQNGMILMCAIFSIKVILSSNARFRK